jgi:PQQ-like domain
VPTKPYVTAAIVGLVLALTGSTAGHAAKGAGGRGWSRTDLHAVSQPAPIGQSLVVYAERNRRLRVIALDRRSGMTRWSAAASTSVNAPGVPPSFAVTDGNVVYLRPVVGPVAELVASAGASGRQLWRTEEGQFTSYPEVCFDDSAAICISGMLRSRQQVSLLRFDARTGRRLASPVISTATLGRELSLGLFDPGQRNPELLVATREATITWRRPLKEIFTLHGASTDWGWDIERAGRAALFVGTVGRPPVKQTSRRLTFDLSRTMTAGFRIADGAVAWRSRGTRYICGYLACVGTGRAGFSSPEDSKGPTVGLRLRMVGTVSVPRRGPRAPSPSAGARVALEGFDPASGRTRWTFDAGHSRQLLALSLLPAQLSANTVVLRNTRGELVAVNLRTGRRRRVASSAHGWCNGQITYELKVAYPPGSGAGSTHYVGQLALFPCTAAGKRVATPDRVPSFIGAAGARAGSLIAWTDMRGVFAAPAR